MSKLRNFTVKAKHRKQGIVYHTVIKAKSKKEALKHYDGRKFTNRRAY